MGRRWPVLVGAALLSYLGFLAALAPASLVASRFGPATQGRLAILDPQGTAWQGRGRLVSLDAAGSMRDLGRLRWEVQVLPIFAGRLRAQVRLAEAEALLVSRSPGRLLVERADLRLPAAVLADWLPLLRSFEPRGELRLSAEGFSVTGEAVDGKARIVWDEALVGRSGLRLGSQVLNVEGRGREARIAVATLRGPLQLEGTGTWSPDAGLAVAGVAHALDPEVIGFLRTVCGEMDSSARCHWRHGPATRP